MKIFKNCISILLTGMMMLSTVNTVWAEDTNSGYETVKAYATDACIISNSDHTYNEHTNFSQTNAIIVTKYDLADYDLSGLKRATLKMKVEYAGTSTANILQGKVKSNEWDGETFTFADYTKINGSWANGLSWVMDVPTATDSFMELDVTSAIKNGDDALSYLVLANTGVHKFRAPHIDSNSYIELQLSKDVAKVENATDACYISPSSPDDHWSADADIAQNPLLIKYDLSKYDTSKVKSATLNVWCRQNSIGVSTPNIGAYKLKTNDWDGDTYTWNKYLEDGNSGWFGDGYTWIGGVTSTSEAYTQIDVTDYIKAGDTELSMLIVVDSNAYKFGSPLSATNPSYLEIDEDESMTENATDACYISFSSPDDHWSADADIAQNPLLIKYNFEDISLIGVNKITLNVWCKQNSIGVSTPNIGAYKLKTNDWDGDTYTWNKYLEDGNSGWFGDGYTWIGGVTSTSEAYTQIDVTDYIKAGDTELSMLIVVDSNAYKFGSPLSATNPAFLSFEYAGKNSMAQLKAETIKDVASQTTVESAVNKLKNSKALFGVTDDNKAAAYAVAVFGEKVTSYTDAVVNYFPKADKGGYMLTKLCDDGTNASVIVKNLSEEQANAPVVIIASFNTDGMLIDAKFATGNTTINEFNLAEYNTSQSLKSNNAVTIKAFAVDSLSSLSPVDEACELVIK